MIPCPHCSEQIDFDPYLHKCSPQPTIYLKHIVARTLQNSLKEVLQKAKDRNESWNVTYPNTPNAYEQGYIHGLEYALLLIKVSEVSK